MNMPDRLYVIQLRGRCGYVNRAGKIVIKPQFAWALDFEQGLAAVVIDHGEHDSTGRCASGSAMGCADAADPVGERWGFIDVQGEIVIPARFESAMSFSEGLAGVKLDGRWGYVDRSGELVIPPRFDSTDVLGFRGGVVSVELNGKEGFIDKRGAYTVSPDFDVVGELAEGLAPVERGGKWGFVDPMRGLVIAVRFDRVRIFSGGLAAVRVGKHWGYINKSGKFVIQAQYERAAEFSEDVAPVRRAGRWFYVNRHNKVVLTLPPEVGEAWEFTEGLAPVKIGDGYGYIDKRGRVVIDPRFKGADHFAGGLALVNVEDMNGDVSDAIIDRAGQFLVKPGFSLLYLYDENGVLRVDDDERRWGYMGRSGKWIWRPTQ